MLQRLEDQIEKESRDLQVLSEVIDNGPVGIGKLADALGVPKHKVRYSLRMLENDELIEPTPQGAVAVDDIDSEIERINAGLDVLIEQLADHKSLQDSLPERARE